MTKSLAQQLLTLEMAGPRDAPKLHKPLLIALLLRRFIEHGSTWTAFTDIEDDLNALIGSFAASASPARAQYSFWRLRRDGFWEIDNAATLQLNSSGDPRVTDLRGANHRGRWTPAAQADLRGCGGAPFLDLVLQRYFPGDLDDLRDALARRADRGDAATTVSAVTIEDVPVEAVLREQAEFERAAKGTATRTEAQLTSRFRDYLEAQGHSVRRYRITCPGAHPLYSDLADLTDGVLCEAKGTSERTNIRLALGQVLDYGRYVVDATLALLLPALPADDLVDLLRVHGVGCIVETPPDRFVDVTGLRRCP